jgi:thermitase
VFKFMLCRLTLIVGVFLSSPQFSSAQNSPHVPGELLIAPKAGVSEADLENEYKAHGGQKIKTLSQIKVHHVKVPDHALEKIEAALANNPKVEFVEKNFIAEANLVPNDPGYQSEWHLPRISAPSGWNITTGSSSVPIAVIDSGVDPNHPDLSGKLIAGYNFLTHTADTRDGQGHGTAVAGTAAASTNSGIGIAGVAWQNPIMPIVVWDAAHAGTYSNISAAINYAADHGAKVINISLSGSSYSSTLQSAVNYAWNKGSVIVAAAGNYSTSSPYYPAALTNVVAVSATNDSSDAFASFSNYGTWITVAAPGNWIYTTQNGGGYWTVYGTSFSTPQVAGLAALLFSLNTALSNSQVVNIIKNSADDVGTPGFDPYYGWGRINIYRALQAAQTTPSSSTSVAITSPSDGSVVSGTVNVNVAASSTTGITKVEFYVNGVLNGSKSSGPYSFPWNTAGLSGSHSLVSKAYDGVGGQATSAAEVVMVASTDTTAPSVQITSIGYDGKFLTVSASATDASGISSVQLYIDGALKATDSSAPYIFKLNARSLSSGTHTIHAKSFDKAGNSSVLASGSFTK